MFDLLIQQPLSRIERVAVHRSRTTGEPVHRCTDQHRTALDIQGISEQPARLRVKRSDGGLVVPPAITDPAEQEYCSTLL